jgi:hypothetical protein
MDCLDVDATWFSPTVQTRGYWYEHGELALTLSGPGMTGTVNTNVGVRGSGNNSHPAGVWQGLVPSGQSITYVDGPEGSETTTPHRLQLRVACANQ